MKKISKKCPICRSIITQKPIVNILAGNQVKRYQKSTGKIDNDSNDGPFTRRNESGINKLFRNKGPEIDKTDNIR